MKLVEGDIILLKVNKFKSLPRQILAKGIQLFERVYYHHALIPVDNELWEAEKVVRKVNYDHLVGHEVLVFRLKQPLTDQEKIKYKQIVKKREKAKYDYWGVLLHQPIHILFGRRIWLGKTHKSARKKPYCTELAIEPIHELRGYFPQPWKVGPYWLSTLAPFYYDVCAEGEVIAAKGDEIFIS